MPKKRSSRSASSTDISLPKLIFLGLIVVFGLIVLVLSTNSNLLTSKSTNTKASEGSDPDSGTFNPVIRSVEPTSFKAGDKVVIKGRGFTNRMKAICYSFRIQGGCNYSDWPGLFILDKWSDTRIEAHLQEPLGIWGVEGTLNVGNGRGKESNKVNIKLPPILKPNISGVQPKVVKSGDTFRIHGTDFGRFSDRVCYDYRGGGSCASGDNFTILDWSNYVITVKVVDKPRNEGALELYIHTGGGGEIISNKVTLEIINPPPE